MTSHLRCRACRNIVKSIIGAIVAQHVCMQPITKLGLQQPPLFIWNAEAGTSAAIMNQFCRYQVTFRDRPSSILINYARSRTYNTLSLNDGWSYAAKLNSRLALYVYTLNIACIWKLIVSLTSANNEFQDYRRHGLLPSYQRNALLQASLTRPLPPLHRYSRPWQRRSPYPFTRTTYTCASRARSTH